jgi:hypothetical protein
VYADEDANLAWQFAAPVVVRVCTFGSAAGDGLVLATRAHGAMPLSCVRTAVRPIAATAHVRRT